MTIDDLPTDLSDVRHGSPNSALGQGILDRAKRAVFLWDSFFSSEVLTVLL